MAGTIESMSTQPFKPTSHDAKEHASCILGTMHESGMNSWRDLHQHLLYRLLLWTTAPGSRMPCGATCRLAVLSEDVFKVIKTTVKANKSLVHKRMTLASDHMIQTNAHLGKVLLVRVQLRWRVLYGHQQNLHWREASKGCMSVSHLQDCDAERPDICQLIVPAVSPALRSQHLLVCTERRSRYHLHINESRKEGSA